MLQPQRTIERNRKTQFLPSLVVSETEDNHVLTLEEYPHLEEAALDQTTKKLAQPTE